MEIINLHRILPQSLKDEIHKCVSEFASENRYRIIFGQVIVSEPVLGKNAIFQVIVSAVCDYFKVSETVVLSRTRKIPFVTYRQMIIYFTEQYMDITQEDIGIMVGIKERSSISHSLKIINTYINTDKKIRYNIKRLDNIIKMMIVPK